MLHFELIRTSFTPDYTEGTLYLGEKRLCDTLEDCTRPLHRAADKIAGRTSIPAGTYQIAWTYSPRFHRNLPLICNVPWFDGIRMHSGNTPKDTAGCILLGDRDLTPGRLTHSRLRTEEICRLIQAAILRGEYVNISLS